MSRIGKPGSVHYDDPINTLIRAIPFLSLEKKHWIIGKWLSTRPEWVLKFTWWYEKHDSEIILLSRIAVTASPILMLESGVRVSIVVPIVILGIYFTEILARKRDALQAEKMKEEAKREYQRERARNHRRSSF